jgi:uncharacterized membrane protein
MNSSKDTLPNVGTIIFKLAIVLAIIGLANATYLSWIKLANATAACAGIGDCDYVNSSKYAEIAGIPIALMGAGAYFAILVFLLIENRSKFFKDIAPFFVFGISLIGVLYSTYLTYVEVAILHAICPYCVLSALILVALLVISVVRLLQDENLDA